MIYSDINLFLTLFFLIMSSLLINVTSALHLLLVAEFMWVTLYILSLLIGYIFDSVVILSLTFFSLIISAAEFGIGLIILLQQNVFFRNISLNYVTTNFNKLNNRFLKRSYTQSFV